MLREVEIGRGSGQQTGLSVEMRLGEGLKGQENCRENTLGPAEEKNQQEGGMATWCRDQPRDKTRVCRVFLVAVLSSFHHLLKSGLMCRRASVSW